jgi:hypothetical protein
MQIGKTIMHMKTLILKKKKLEKSKVNEMRQEKS